MTATEAYTEIARLRQRSQHLSWAPFATAAEAVAWFGAVQAQDYLGSLWAVGQRVQQVHERDVEQAMATGAIIRTHPMRGTWHYIAAADVRWLLRLMAPRTIPSVAGYYRRLELDEATIAKSLAVFTQTLQGGKQGTRHELKAALEHAGISTADLRLTFLLSRAEAEGVICSGPRRGKQFTYALLDEVVPTGRERSREESVAELVRRYFLSHGPATVQDFVWWSGLTTADTTMGLQLVKADLVKEVIGGKTYWLAPSTRSEAQSSTRAYLLPPYDEYTVAYKDRSAVLDPAHAEQTRNGIFSPVMIVDGRIAGLWSRTLKKNTVALTMTPLTPLNDEQERLVAEAAERYRAFLGLAAAPTV
jgi:hypothetical protein